MKDRLKKPLIRREGVEKKKIDDYSKLKVEDFFREASWKEVIELSATKLNEY